MNAQLEPDGTFSAPVVLEHVNSPFLDIRPTVRRDGLELYFDSNRPDGLGGTDIWVSTRASVHDAWSPPTNPGPSVNSPADEARAALSFNRLWLVFQSTRPGGQGGPDLYMASRIPEP